MPSIRFLYAAAANRDGTLMGGLPIWDRRWRRVRDIASVLPHPLKDHELLSVEASEPDPEPPILPEPSILRVGQDSAGHWLVQESGGRLEGRFISFAAAMAFARVERHGFPGCSVAVATAPLVPQISFAPVDPWENAWPKAA